VLVVSEEMMRLLLRCSIASFVFCIVVGLVSVLTFNGLLAMLDWPGIILVNKVYARLGFYASDFKTALPWLVPGLLIDFVLYALLFWAVSVAWQMVHRRRDASAGN
jgi:hypothetical protein